MVHIRSLPVLGTPRVISSRPHRGSLTYGADALDARAPISPQPGLCLGGGVPLAAGVCCPRPACLCYGGQLLEPLEADNDGLEFVDK